MKHLTEMKPGETLHLRSGRDLELESVTPVTCGVMLNLRRQQRPRHNQRRGGEILRQATDTRGHTSGPM